MPGRGMENSEDNLVTALIATDEWSAEELANYLREIFYIQTHAERNDELARIASFQQDLKNQVRAEIALENGNYSEQQEQRQLCIIPGN